MLLSGAKFVFVFALAQDEFGSREEAKPRQDMTGIVPVRLQNMRHILSLLVQVKWGPSALLVQ